DRGGALFCSAPAGPGPRRSCWGGLNPPAGWAAVPPPAAASSLLRCQICCRSAPITIAHSSWLAHTRLPGSPETKHSAPNAAASGPYASHCQSATGALLPVAAQVLVALADRAGEQVPHVHRLPPAGPARKQRAGRPEARRRPGEHRGEPAGEVAAVCRSGDDRGNDLLVVTGRGCRHGGQLLRVRGKGGGGRAAGAA